MKNEELIDAIALESAKIYIADQIGLKNEQRNAPYGEHRPDQSIFEGRYADPELIAEKMFEVYRYTREKLKKIVTIDQNNTPKIY